jgi:AcrR family transcriptional regulator
MPKIVDHDAYRKELVEQALDLFIERGYHGIGMREIAQALNVSKSALYHYFPSKDALFEAVIEAVVQDDLAAFATYDPGQAATRKERLQALLRYCADREDWFVRQFMVLIDYVRGKSPAAIRTTDMSQSSMAYVRFIQAYLQLEDESSAIALLAMINGLILQRLLDGQTTDFNQVAEWILEHWQI